ncbi:MAG: hypothetical protein GC195_10720 [Nostoc sp. RI_552]|nr:hypothetical protein [Nostoc sp. RI_552]
MSLLVDRSSKILLGLPSSHPKLLEGLDIWLQLGLISDSLVRQVCQQFLVCPVQFEPERLIISEPLQPLPLAAVAPSIRIKTPKKPPQPNLAPWIFQSLGAQLRVHWLLSLGLFLVLVSSGVLAASHWERFPASGQYGVLFAYTLSFWGLGFWASKQNNLKSTARTFLIFTLLLVPMNFWVMDSFELWENYGGRLTMAMACPALTLITSALCKNPVVFANITTAKSQLVNILTLSCLHWGWQVHHFPVIAIYLGTLATTITTINLNRYQQQPPITSVNQSQQPGKLGMSLFAAVIVYGLALLLVRAIFVTRVDVTQLGLAIGICGWLATWLAQYRHPSFPLFPWQTLGSILLFLGWLITVVNQPGQAIVVSGFAVWYLGNRLKRYTLAVDLAVLFAIDLQIIWLTWRLVPFALQEKVIAIGVKLTNAENEPWALLSVALFPFLIFMVAITEKINYARYRKLAQYGQLLTFLFGGFLTAIAAINPTLRSLNLLFSTLVLVAITNRRSFASIPLIYLTHIIGLLTLCSTINWLLYKS